MARAKPRSWGSWTLHPSSLGFVFMGLAAGFAYFSSFLKTADEFGAFGKTQLPMPVTSIGGEKANGEALGAQMKLISAKPTIVIIKGSGHWMMEEKPEETIVAVTRELEKPATAQR